MTENIKSKIQKSINVISQFNYRLYNREQDGSYIGYFLSRCKNKRDDYVKFYGLKYKDDINRIFSEETRAPILSELLPKEVFMLFCAYKKGFVIEIINDSKTLRNIKNNFDSYDFVPSHLQNSARFYIKLDSLQDINLIKLLEFNKDCMDKRIYNLENIHKNIDKNLSNFFFNDYEWKDEELY